MPEPMAEAFNVELREVDLRALFDASDEKLTLARRMEAELHYQMGARDFVSFDDGWTTCKG